MLTRQHPPPPTCSYAAGLEFGEVIQLQFKKLNAVVSFRFGYDDEIKSIIYDFIPQTRRCVVSRDVTGD